MSRSSPGTFRSIGRLLPFMRPALPAVTVSGIAALVGSLISLVIPVILQSLVDGPLSSGDAAQVWPGALLVLGLGVVEAAIVLFRRWLVMNPVSRVEARIRNTIYGRLQVLPVAFHDRWASGQLLSRAMSDVNQVRRWLTFGVVFLVVNVVTIVVGFVILATWSWILAIIFIVCAIPIWIYGFIFERRYSVVARRSRDQQGDLATAIEESIHGIRVLKAFGRGAYSLEKFTRKAERLRGTEMAKARADAGLWLWLVLIPDVAFAICLLGGLWLAAVGDLTVGQLFAFFATATVLRFPIEGMGFLLTMTIDTRTAADRFFEILDEPDPIADPEHARTVDEPRGRLVFDGVHFRYQDAPAGSRDLLDGIDLELEPGETMALVGLTGSGKTTLTALATRLYDVTAGAVRLDGVDIRDLRREELRTHVAMAFEDATLFSASVRENVLLGRPELDGDPETGQAVLDEALEIAQAEFVAELPDGADTRVGEEGLSLSGGQRQRLALARAVAAKPAVLVLDDPLSALDVDTEARVEAGLRRVLSATTALIVAHRPSTVMLADRVALLQDGRVTAVGRHSDLLATNAHYRYVISSFDDEPREVNA
jgi:ATP-binding cassette subfamily B protein